MSVSRSLVLVLALLLVLVQGGSGLNEERAQLQLHPSLQPPLPLPLPLPAKKAARLVMRCNDQAKGRPAYSKLVAPVKFRIPQPNEFDHIFYTEFLGGCDVDRACVHDLVQAMEHGNHDYVQHYLAPGTVFFLPAASKNPKTWLVKDILKIFDHYNVSSSSYTLVHVADESRNWNSPAIISFYREWQRVFRQTWHLSEEYTNLTKVCIDYSDYDEISARLIIHHFCL
jgi:hypothetical protein